MPGNYGLNGQDWYNQRLNQIASMMSMQNTDPNYLLGSLIGDTLRKPFQNWLDNKVLPTITGSGESLDNNSGSKETQFQQVNGTYQAEPTANNPTTTGNRQTDVTIASFLPNQQSEVSFANTVQPEMNMDFTRLGQVQMKQSPPTQAEVNEATNNATNQAVTQEAQQQGNMEGIMNNLGNGVINSAVANAFGINPFQQASSLGNGGEASYDEAMQNALLREIYKAKQDYAVAQQNNDIKGMQRANDAATLERQMAREYGIDVSAGDSNVTIDDLADTMLREQARQQQEAQQKEAERIRNMTPQELLQQPDITVSPNAFYQRIYQQLNNKGIPEYRARQKAADMAMQYEANYMNELQKAMSIGGFNSDGSLNSAGVELLSRATLANNPEMAQLYANQFASPREQWGFARDIDKANLQQKFNQENINTKYNQDIDMLARKTAAQKDVNSFNTGLQLKVKDYVTRLEMSIRNQSEQSKANARQDAAQQLVSDGVWDKGQGLLYVLTGKMPNSGSDNNSSSDKTPAWSRPLAEGYSKAKGTLDAEDIDDFKNEVAKYRPEMDEEDSTYANSMILALEGLREDRAGNKEMAAKYFSGIPDYYKEVLLPGY